MFSVFLFNGFFSLIIWNPFHILSIEHFTNKVNPNFIFFIKITKTSTILYAYCTLPSKCFHYYRFYFFYFPLYLLFFSQNSYYFSKFKIIFILYKVVPPYCISTSKICLCGTCFLSSIKSSNVLTQSSASNGTSCFTAVTTG